MNTHYKPAFFPSQDPILDPNTTALRTETSKHTETMVQQKKKEEESKPCECV